MSPTFAAFSVRNYRIWWTGAFVSNIGTWMGRVAQDWLVLTELTKHSASALGLVTGLQFAPMLLLAPFSGVIVDRLPKRRLLVLTQAGLLLTSLLLSMLVVTDTVQLWHVYVLATLQGVITAVDNPARQTFVSEVVPKERIANAVALNSASFNGARIIGPAVAGLAIAAWGTGPALLANTTSFAFVLLSLAAMNAAQLRPAPLHTGRGGIRAGFAYVRSRPDLQIVMFLIFMLGTFGMNFQITTALMATKAFGKGAGEFGLLSSIMAIGSLAAALLAARREEPRLRVLLVALGGFAVATAAASIAPTYWTFAAALVPCGLCGLTAMTTANAMVQLRTDPAMRGRVMALYMAIFMGGTPLGAPVIGWIGDAWGPRWTIAIGSIAVALALIVVGVWIGSRENVRVSYETHRRPHLLVSVVPARDSEGQGANAELEVVR